MRQRRALTALLWSLGLAACSGAEGTPPFVEPPTPDAGPEAPPPPPPPPPRHDVVEDGEDRPGGATTVATPGAVTAFKRPAANLTLERRAEFFIGEAVFEADWLPAPSASRAERDGLGPLFHSVSCVACHVGSGRGRPPEEGEVADTLLVRLSVPGVDAHGAPVPEPTYGDQLQPRGIPGVPAEGQARMRWTEVPGTFADGVPYSLAAPELLLTELAHGPLAPGTRTSARVAQPMMGLGLLAAVPESTWLEWADPDDADGDGISGRPNRVWSRREGRAVLGRFGWKANQPDLEHQNSAALLGDMGLTSPLFADEGCMEVQAACRAAPTGGAPEVSERQSRALDFYSHTLAVPGRERVDAPEVLAGKAVFHRVGCARCHRPSLTTGTLAGYPELSGQRIWPYTDGLLHDLGEALADGREDFLATGREWRTPPLWGLGRTRAVNGHTRLLHDGRARSPLEAILWHGGEAEAAREAVRHLTQAERDALVAFLDSL
ncbi:di-heme oxidoreductase family protein [Pyxidicoccus xibeiensis]|uniref:di-heme oxidoreductase family protein n=1 Tax=Pyxidicoccus xibeiensis TaxID=2906759 RepID=UPI0020A73DD6|nr:di-heme oxidoredictase family protein [Pyxidicoccus xibeiensis]MCP3138297.1 c-type cytochrome [Pyxidicoccus xibeiensis]